jgi:hypothetical protein
MIVTRGKPTSVSCAAVDWLGQVASILEPPARDGSLNCHLDLTKMGMAFAHLSVCRIFPCLWGQTDALL